jgi:hypothetical protein
MGATGFAEVTPAIVIVYFNQPRAVGSGTQSFPGGGFCR